MRHNQLYYLSDIRRTLCTQNRDKKGLDYLQLKFDEVENRVDKVEQDLQHLPSAKDVVALQVAIKEMRGETYALRSSIKGLSRLVDLLVEKEVNKGDK
nr:DUF2730 family protein [Psychrobacter sp. PraFG1]UNK05826.1 DUF2730 domain-containing protein [Psychrobacter sp. PraFG1]